ncbi:sulfotransferase family protein [Sphingomonas arenae]|uniref:sulfotransferase family protein n=1 Tax=Sphingomonas arenae TaxID=2812555 RepID=UPI0019686155|nr:sulfotransferase [Sphingomonas arenae]
MQPDKQMAFIVGAPRCGTTTLSSLLRQHPEVCFSAVKEPHFFPRFDLDAMSDEELRSLVRRDYLDRFFAACGPDQKVLAEGSVSYLYAPEAMRGVLRLWPDARFIIALRDPLSMIPSLHARLLMTGDETITDFAKAWAMVPERAAGRAIPRSAADPRWLRYDEAGRFGTHVQRFFDVVGRERCHVVLFDDLTSNPQGTYAALCGFLGLEPFPGTSFKARRQHFAYRWGWLQRLLKRPPKAVQSMLAGEKFNQREGQQAKKGAIMRVRKHLLDWNKVPAKRKALDPAVRRQIVDRLRGEVVILSRLLDRDLSHWLGGVPEATGR